ncbi:unnamed protein product [Brassica napus]|uniref:(rape) hypothetical protein n=1 Tax=Brassica napus TaxID=3708 RepID=A0A816P3W1_BRANA|nr:unnamed protein product [Brassica napus]
MFWGGTCDWKGGGSNLSDKGLNFSGTWQQGHSASYNTPSRGRNGLSQRHVPLGAEAPTEGPQSGGGRMRCF